MHLRKDLLSGSIFIATAAIFGIAAANYNLGTLYRVGPGLFPLILCALLATLGLMVIVSGLRTGAPTTGNLPWRAIVLIVASPLVFVGCMEVGTGLVPATAVLAFIGSFASRAMTLRRAALCALALALATWLIFILGLGVMVPAFGPEM
jgi:hypothetical protein